MTKTEMLNKMREKGTGDALEIRNKSVAGELTDTEIIDNETAIPAFVPEKDYTGCAIGTPIQDGGQVYGLLQPHNASHYPDQRPADLRALWGLKHTKNPEKAKPFVAPFGTSGLYQTGECMVWTDGRVYLSAADNNAYTPETMPEYWSEYTPAEIGEET